MPRPKPVVLMILDGWGIAAPGAGNSIKLARTPNLDYLFQTYPHTRLQTSGTAVGLPDGVMGNSEVGHLNIGAGRTVFQDLLRIDNAVADGRFFDNRTLVDAMKTAAQSGKSLHMMGLVSDGGVHSQLNHVFALLKLARQYHPENVFVHAILDGRDTPPDSGQRYVAALEDQIEKIGVGSLVSICGRYYAMDRDTRWDRTEKAFRLYTEALGSISDNPVAAVRQAYDRGQSDEFIQPIVISRFNRPTGTIIADGDVLIFFNFRADRARQITRAFTERNFSGFSRRRLPDLGSFVCMTLYDEKFNLPVAFPPEHLNDILGEVLSAHRLRQLRIAETEKYAHVTYFFNGGEESPFTGEDRCLIPSPRDVATYDLKPEMSAPAVTEEVLTRVMSDWYDMVVVNFANMDMVGHTGVLSAAIKACETVDVCVGRITRAVLEKNGVLLITSDHGNAETMRDDTGKIHTAHTTHPAPLILVSDADRETILRQGSLGDIAPTILDLMGISQPRRMTGKTLIAEKGAGMKNRGRAFMST